MGKILRVDLGFKNFSTEELDPKLEEKYIGGAGIAAAIFINEVPPKIDPLDEHNLLIFSVGPICGTPIPYCGRHFVMAKSPLTGILGESSAGGFFGNELRRTGYDHVIISGVSEKPAYLWINDDTIEIRDATKLWGKGTRETEDLLFKEIEDEKAKIASIGPAGENLVKFSSIMNEKSHAAGRCGMGAVMGSKKLKAIVVRGTKEVFINNRDKLMDSVQKIRTVGKTFPLSVAMQEGGTPIHMDNYVSSGDVPIKNFTLSRWKGTKSIGYYAIKSNYETKHYSCFNCGTACRAKIKFNNEWVEWPEYELLTMLGSNLLVDDLDSLVRWNIMINDYGMDCISLGGVLAVFIEAIERKLIDINYDDLGFEKDPESGEYNIWDAISAIENLITKTAFRKEIGDDLAQGVRFLCQKYSLPNDLNIQVKGLEVPAHEPRANNMTALDYATSSRGAYHCYEPLHLSFLAHLKKEIGLTERIDPFSIDESVTAVKKIQDACEAYTATGGCIFGFWYSSEISPWVNAVNAITGRSYTVEDWVKIGENLFNMKRKYNEKCGISKKDDSLSSRFSNPLSRGGTKKNVPPLKEMLQKYYKLRGWNNK